MENNTSDVDVGRDVGCFFGRVLCRVFLFGRKNMPRKMTHGGGVYQLQ